YRPRTAVDCFLRWAAQPEDNLTKEKFYPNIERAELITKGYVASQSSHSRGSAIDLTLYHLDTGELVSMGSNFDFMDERSHHTAKGIGDAEAQNRRCLRKIMESSGFQSYRFEWWHYKLIDEPYPDTYFNFAVS
ncbi:TPA: M15 family metallopeptidase, partial [Enterococcus faecium]